MVEFRSFMDVNLIDFRGTDEKVVAAARVSTDSIDNKDRMEGLIRYLARESHSTPFEHCGITVEVNVPLFVAQQIFRHRTFSYSALSLRYTEASPHFYIPDVNRPLKNEGSSAHPKLVQDDEIPYGAVLDVHVAASTAAWGYYQELIEMGVANEVARNVLPQNTFTKLWMTGNLWNWSKFLKLRNGEHGHPQHEIADVADRIQWGITELFPISMKYLMEKR